MKAKWELETHRIKEGPFKSTIKDGRSGAFSFVPDLKRDINIIAIADAGDKDDTGWERVAITVQCLKRSGRKKKIIDRPPYHYEVILIKSIFWDDCEKVIQVYGKDIGDPRGLVIELWRKKDGTMVTPFDHTENFPEKLLKFNKEQKEKEDGKGRTSETEADTPVDKV